MTTIFGENVFKYYINILVLRLHSTYGTVLSNPISFGGGGNMPGAFGNNFMGYLTASKCTKSDKKISKFPKLASANTVPQKFKKFDNNSFTI